MLPLQCQILFSQSETGDKASVSVDICLSEVLEKVSSLSYHLQKTSSGVVVFVMLFEVLVEVVDPVSKDSYLNLRGTCVAFFSSILFDDFLFFSFVSIKINSFSLVRPLCVAVGDANHCGAGILN